MDISLDPIFLEGIYPQEVIKNVCYDSATSIFIHHSTFYNSENW